MPDVRLEPMSDEEYAEFRERSEASYAAAIDTLSVAMRKSPLVAR
ncbi:MAG TPA: hypothetical protein VKA58_03770 [Propionibacteriaceae bacterium]|nr:hypothetical protein [Propionibacteriaceae bacterium]